MIYLKYVFKVFNIQKFIYGSMYMFFMINEGISLSNNDIYFYINEKIEIISEIDYFSIVKIRIVRTGKLLYVDRNQIKEYIVNSNYITPKIYKRSVI
jgi:hypothetical protein